MNIIEILLIVAGISLDIFAAMEIEGAMLAKIKPKTLGQVSALVVLMQQIFFFFGYAVSVQVVEFTSVLSHPKKVGHVIAILIFLFLGLRLGVKAYKRETINERLREITVSQYLHIIAVASIYSIFAGIACGLVGVNVLFVFVTIIISSIIVTVGGIFTGYHFGVAGKTVVYGIGTVLLMAAGIEMLLRSILQII